MSLARQHGESAAANPPAASPILTNHVAKIVQRGVVVDVQRDEGGVDEEHSKQAPGGDEKGPFAVRETNGPQAIAFLFT